MSGMLDQPVVVYLNFEFFSVIFSIKYEFDWFQLIASSSASASTINKNHSDYITVSLSSYENGPKLRGRIVEEQQIKLAQFLGIRYALPPKRFKRTKLFPVSEYGNGTIIDAIKWPPFCLQPNLKQFEYLTKIFNYNQTEDCLYLNIWTPLKSIPETSTRTRTRTDDDLLPVIVFIHGGSFSHMGISMEAFYGGLISSIGKVVFITLNYRLGIYGFLNNPLEGQSEDEDYYFKNLGLYDQILALEWIHKNIKKFGGNPKKITLQGQSAGAISIGLLMYSEKSKKLFKRAILQSASPMMLKQIYQMENFQKILKLTNCTGNPDPGESGSTEYDYEEEEDYYDESESEESEPDMENEIYNLSPTTTPLINLPRYSQQIQCLEKFPANELNEIQSKLLENSTIIFAPSIPSKLLPKFFMDESEESESESEDNFYQKELLIGANQNESTLFLHHELPHLLPFIQNEHHQKLSLSNNHQNLNLSKEDLLKIFKKLDSSNTNLLKISSMIFNILERKQQQEHRQQQRLNPNGFNPSSQQEDFTQLALTFLSDLMFKGPVFKFAKFFSQNPRHSTYLYLFNEWTWKKYPKWIGTGHWNEMDYVFGIPLLHPEEFSKEQQEFSRRIIKIWTNFAKTGKPSSTQQQQQQLDLEWPKFDEKHQLHMNLMALENENQIVNSIGKRLDMKFFNFFDLIYNST